jgi:hypothetical protein
MFVFGSSSGSAGELKHDSVYCLKIKGRVLNAEDGYASGCKVELLNSQGVIEQMDIKDNKARFAFKLKRNAYYAIRVSKAGFVSRIISINTEFPAEINDVCEFAFDTKLISVEEAKELNGDALDFPIAIVHFHEGTEMFIHNREYTEQIRKEIQSKPAKYYSTAIAGQQTGN